MRFDGIEMACTIRHPAPRLTGAKVSLVEFTAEDVTERYLGWLRDAEITRFLEARFDDHTNESLRLYVQSVGTDPNSVLFRIVLHEGSSHIGNIKLGPINWHHRFGDVGILIGERGQHGKGLGTEAISLLTDYAFGNLGLHKLTASMYEQNEASRRAFERAGFEFEGFRKSQYLDGDSYTGLVLMGCVRESTNDE